MIVDAWIQHPGPTMLADPMFAPLVRWTGGKPLPALPPEMTMALLDAGKVDRALVSAWHGPRGALCSNDEVHALVARWPDRLVGVASVDLHRPADAVRELRRAVGERGFRGLRMLPWLWDAPPDDRRFYPLYMECIELGVPFCLQVGHTGPLAPSEWGRPIPYLDRVCLDFPELVVVAGHIGWPWVDEMISLARKYPGVHIDTSAYTPSRYPPALVEYMRSRSGRNKVMFGSNSPMLQPAACLAQVDALGLDDEARALFLGGNAMRVFGLGGHG
ncbi:MAG: amidohydrolase [Deltaproteobacteria bacterium]|nr:amidohydrolase [Deltaproteobacteria bacterium]